MTEPPTTHTIDEALAKFQLIGGSPGDPAENTACVMTAISWVAGESWSDYPRCAHPVLANLAIRANDHDGTTEDERAAIVRAGATGLIDTWWLPGEVVAWCISEGMKAAELPVERCLATLAAVDAWKATKQRPDLARADLARADLARADLARADLARANLARANLARANLTGAYLAGANLARANLTGANLTDANLAGANLTRADLAGANLTGANLARADLGGADLGGADLGGADLGGAYLTGANLTGADLGGANLTRANLADANLTGANLTGAYLAGAYLGGADLTGADLTRAKCNEFTVPPAGWTVNKATWRMEREAVDAHEQAPAEVEAVPA